MKSNFNQSISLFVDLYVLTCVCGTDMSPHQKQYTIAQLHRENH